MFRAACSCLFALTAASAQAGFVVSVSGDVVDSGPVPATLQGGAQSSDTNIFLFHERSGVLLNAPLAVNQIDPGTYTTAGSFTLAAGTTVDSYLLHYDRLAGSLGGRADGTVTFSGVILGIIGTSSGLDASDVILGNPGTLYPTSNLRGFWDSGRFDSATISADRRTLTFGSRVDNSLDELRVVVAPAVPEPGSLALLATGGLGLFGGWYRRRKQSA